MLFLFVFPWGRGKGRTCPRGQERRGSGKRRVRPRIGALSRMDQGAPGTAGLKVGLSFGFKTKGTFCQSGRHRAGASGRGMYKRPRLRQPTAQAWARSAGTEVWGFEPPPPADFPHSQYKTHTYTHTASTLFLALAPAGQTEVRGGRGPKMAARLRAARLSPLHVGRPGPVFTSQCGPIEWGGRLPRPGRPGRGAPAAPCAPRVSAKEPG